VSLKRCCCVFEMRKVGSRGTEAAWGRSSICVVSVKRKNETLVGFNLTVSNGGRAEFSISESGLWDECLDDFVGISSVRVSAST
jgi:hypothetical protein